MNSVALINGTIITVDEKQPTAEAVLIEDGKITGVGGTNDIAAAAKERSVPCVDLAGKTAVPGLHDCHVHAMGTGLNAAGVDVYQCESVKDVLDTVQAASEKTEEGWIYCSRLDESRLKEKRPPTMQEIDQVVADRGVFLVDRGLHYTLVNAVAFEEIGFSGNEPGLRIGDDGRPTGRLHDKANGMARSFFYDHRMTDKQRSDMYDYTAQEAVKKGITTIHAMEGGIMFSDKDIPVFLKKQKTFPLDMLLYWDTDHIEEVAHLGIRHSGTDMLLDGSIGSRTAAFDDPYSDDFGIRGEIYFDEDFVVNHIVEAHRRGLQAGFHAIGQRGIRFLLDCLEKALKIYPCEDHRFRIEHFGWPDDRDIERAVKMGCVISSQPAFTYTRADGPESVYRLRLGAEREKAAYRFRAYLDAGLKIGGGSDSGVTPMDPIFGMHAAVNQPTKANSVTVQEALRMFTLDGAYCAFEEKEKGSITVGKWGDITVLSDDPYAVGIDKIKTICPIMTIHHGKMVHEARGEAK